MPTLDQRQIQCAVRAALAEDLGVPREILHGRRRAAARRRYLAGQGDVTTLATVPAGATLTVRMRARETLVVAGLDFAEAAFRELSPRVSVKRLARDGQKLKAGNSLLQVTGSARAILSAERVALNFVQRLSGVATLTAQYVAAISGTRARILDTRKTTPGWRLFEKYAVVCGGGKNHRIGLFDMVRIKDNHLAALRDAKPSAIAAAVQRARKRFPKLKVEAEADTLTQVRQAADAGADIILLDNMKPARLRAAITLIAGRAKAEASGGVNLKTVRAIAKTGVDFISVGALTHSAPAVDIGLDYLEAKS